MANLTSSKKQARKNIKHRLMNQARLSAIRTAVKKVSDALEQKNVEQAQQFLRVAQAHLIRAQSKGTIHANNARRRVSRLALKVAAIAKTK